MAEYRLYDLAKVIRSKNSGPFQTTLDVLFDDEKIYRKIKESGLITRKHIAMPVSYTHLDVYKRQVLPTILTNMG